MKNYNLNSKQVEKGLQELIKKVDGDINGCVVSFIDIEGEQYTWTFGQVESRDLAYIGGKITSIAYTPLESEAEAGAEEEPEYPDFPG